VIVIHQNGKEVYRRQWSEVYEEGPYSMSRPEWQHFVQHFFDTAFVDHAFVPARTYGSEHHTRVAGLGCRSEDPRECIAADMKYSAVHARWQQERRDLSGLLRPGDSVQTAYFREVRVEPFDTVLVDQIWNDIREHAPVVFGYSCGDECREEIAWSRLKQSFITVFRAD
jgi:hypothetical protein